MKRRTKKTYINQPTVLSSVELDDLDDGDNGEWVTSVNGSKAHRRKSHGGLASLHFRHFRYPRGK
jgi:hypothetical protein